MNRPVAQHVLRPHPRSRLRQKARIHRVIFEFLEDRTMLDAGSSTQLPAAIVVGRTLATPVTAGTAMPAPSYFVGEVQNNQVTITYTVYNEQADKETGVLLRTTLEPGVTILNSSVTLDDTTTAQLPDKSGQNLAWSLQPINGYDRESIAVTVSLPSPTPLQLDTGAHVYAMLDAGAVSASTPAATLQPGNVSDPSLLASTVDADTNDPFIQEEAAALNYDPNQIFSFLHTQIGYNSYLGSVRGARGTLWSSAGNALDVASLGVALMRASGIPAQYVSGTLSQSDAQELILSMFPAQYQTVGYIPSGTQTSDPSNDPQLLSETESHYWFQFDTGSGMTDADPLMPGATIGQTFTPSTGTFTAVHDNLEEKTEVQLVAEITNTASALFGLGGQQDTTVLDQTFDDVELVGRPISLGFNVSSSSAGFTYTTTTNTYSPYLAWGDDAYDSTHDQIIQGQSFQEVLTNFPLASTVLTGLFLNVVESGPQGPSQTFSRTLLNRIGYAARQGSATTSVSIPAGDVPALSNLDIYTLDVSAAADDPHPTAELNQELQNDAAELAAVQNTAADAQIAETYATDYGVDLTRILGNNFLTLSQLQTSTLATTSGVVAYFDSPRIVLISQQLETDSATTSAGLTTAIDLVNDSPRVEPAPGQTVAATFLFNLTRGIFENVTERNTVAALLPSGQTLAVDNTYDLFNAATAQGIGFTDITSANLNVLDGLNIPADAKARITTDVLNGFGVIVPDQSVMLNGVPTIAWAEINFATGEYIGVDANGGHEGALEFLALVGENLELQISVIKFFSPVAAFDAGAELSLAYELNVAIGDQKEAAKELKEQKDKVTEAYDGLVTSVELVSNELSLANPAEISNYKGLDQLLSALLEPLRDQLSKIVQEAKSAFEQALDGTVLALTGQDPGVTPILSNPLPVTALPANQASGSVAETGQLPVGPVGGSVETASVSVSHQIAATWSSTATSDFQVTALNSSSGTIVDSSGETVGAGAMALAALSPVSAALSGNDQYSVSGTGSLSFYGPAESSLGVSGDWQNYSATVTGNVSITLTVPDSALTLDGQALPAGTYTITTSSATLSGSGATSSPNFAGSVSINATGGTINLGPGTGSLSVGGKPLNSDDETTLDGYTGTISVSANGDGTDSVSLNGHTGNILQVTTSPATLTTDQNTPLTFATNVQTSLADTYNLTANAPAGWTVSIDSKGNVTASPAPGLQSGTYPIQIIAQSQTDSNLVAQTTINVTITPTQPGINFTVASDPVFTVPFNGAQLPTAFRASIQNLGPAADTYNLTFSNVPTGFTILDSGTSVTVPAGETGILGVYLEPNTGQPIPPPGTELSFTVTATSMTNSAITKTQTETFTVPDIDAVTVTNDPSSVNTTPGTAVADTITLSNIGNVPETVSLAATLPSGLTGSALTPVTLAVGQSTTETITLTPDASTPLNSTLDATITATFGPSASPETQTVQIPVSVVVPGAAAIANASIAAGQLGNTNLADRLNDLSTALTNLVQNPTSAVYKSQALASLDAVSALMNSDPFLSAATGALANDRSALAQATSTSSIQSALKQLGNDLDTVGTSLADEAAHGFTLSLLNNSRVGQPHVPTMYQVFLQNAGTQPTTYDLSIAGLPTGVTGMLSQSSITLQPGQSTLVAGGATSLNAMITSTSVADLPSFSFSINATAEGAPEITRASVAEFAARPASIQVISVATSPPFTNPGGQVDVSAQVLDAVNQQQQAQVSYTVADPNGNVIFTSQPVPATLNVLSTLSTVDLGNFDTTNLADGEYTINAAVDDASGDLIPGATAQGTLLVGTPVTAGLSTLPRTLPAGNGTVTSALQIDASGASGETTAQFAVPGTSDPYLAGMPDGSTASDGDTAPAESPAQVVGIPIVAGSQLTFTASGSVSYEPGVAGAGPDGLLGYFASHSGGAENGISGVTAPVDSLLGVFLGPDQPDGSPAPTNLDFSSTGNVPGGVNYTSLAPELQQVFFIGDGLTSAGTPQTITVPAGATRLFLATMDGFGWNNNTGSFQVQVTLLTSNGVSVQARATVPTNNGVSIDPNSFSIAPTSITTGSGTETLEWDLNLPLGTTGQTITWKSDVTGLQPGQSIPVVQGATVGFVSQGTPGSLTLPAQFVTGEQIIGIKPASQTVQPGAPASYDVTLLNPTGSSVTYALSVQGVSSSWVMLPATVTVSANGSVDVPLTLKSDSFAALSDYGFTVSASGDDGATASVAGDLVLQGQPALPDPEAHGIVAEITPTESTAGQGTSARFVVQLTNSGSADDSFRVTANGLPQGVTASLGQTTINVPPGASNFRDDSLTLNVAAGTAPGTYPFTVTATSTSDAAVSTTTSGTLVVVASGVQVKLNPPSGAPGSGFQMTVTNTGTTTDTYTLALGGPAGLVSSLGTKQVTVAAGASQVVPISTGAVNFAVQGDLNLMGIATSGTNPAVQAAATAALSIPATLGMTASFSPATQPLSQPGAASFLLMVHNTGNTEDSYTARIIGTSGPITANLVGLDGSPTQTIPIFILPGLSTGAILVQTDLSAFGQGTVTVQVTSLNHGAITASTVATVIASMPKPVPIPLPSDGPEITLVQRYGIHRMPTTLVLYFNQALDPARAQDVQEYQLVDPHGHDVAITAADYEPTTDTVTLHLSRRINFHRPYKLTVDGASPSGLTDSQGVLLDGKATGHPGSNYVTTVYQRDLVWPDRKKQAIPQEVSIKDPRSTKLSTGHDVHGTQLFKRSWPFPASGSVSMSHGKMSTVHPLSARPRHLMARLQPQERKSLR